MKANLHHPPLAGGSQSQRDCGEGFLIRSKPRAVHRNQKACYRKAAALRQTGSFIERLLWRALRSDPEQRVIKFRYQHSFSPYVVDFACLLARLIVEVDGPSHDALVSKDQRRQNFLEEQGYVVLRFSNSDVLADVNAVAATIRHKARELMEERWTQSNPSPHAQARATLPQGEGDLEDRLKGRNDE